MATPEEAYERLVQGFNDHDVDAIMASYTQDAQLITPDGELRGQAAIRAYWAVWLEAVPDIPLTPTRSPTGARETSTENLSLLRPA